MTLISDAELLSMLQTAGAVSATVGESTIEGIFDRDYDDTLDVAGNAPRFMARTSDLSAASVARETAITIDGTGYTVANIEADGNGLSLLELIES